MTEGFELTPYDRRRCGPRNQFVFRRHVSLPETAAKAIARRDHPAWSQMREEVSA